jgi:hypothetical protein
MTSHSSVNQEESTTELPPTDSEFDVEEDSESDVEEDSGSEMDEEEIKKWYSTTYERGSKKPMKEPFTAPWDLPISDVDMEKLKAGFKSRSMDLKWDMLVEDPDEDGNISVHIIRNWLQEECYILHIVPKPSDDDSKSAKMHSITWEGTKPGLRGNGKAELAKKQAVILCRVHLHCEFETLPDYPGSVFRVPIANTAPSAE